MRRLAIVFALFAVGCSSSTGGSSGTGSTASGSSSGSSGTSTSSSSNGSSSSGTSSDGTTAASSSSSSSGSTGSGGTSGCIATGTEVCDGQDNDCDGSIDQYPDAGPLRNGSCYDFDAGTPNTGACRPGVLTCSGGQFLCEGEVGPTAEICWNDADENCDGQLDDGCTAPISGFTPGAGGPGATVVLVGPNFPPSPTVTLALPNSVSVSLTVLSSTSNRIVARIANTTAHGVGQFEVSYKGTQVGTSSQSFLLTAASNGLVAQGTFDVGNAPTALALGDLNHDGIPDALVSFFQAADGGLDVLPGQPDGGFGPPALVDTLFAASGYVGIADLNGDGWADAFAVDSAFYGSPHTVDVLLNRGDGGLGAPGEYPAGIQTVSAAVGDLNGDGAADLLVFTANSASATPVFGLADGGFAAGAITYLTSSPYMTWGSLADMNEDGVLDELTGDYRNSIGIAPGQGDGTFGSRTAGAASRYHPEMFAVADVNGDGHLDVISAEVDDANAGYVSVYPGGGTETLSSVTSYPVSPYQVSRLAVADLNGDGNPDVATIAGHSLFVFSGSSDGGLQDGGVYSMGSSIPEELDVADMNRDDKLDVVVGTLEGQLVVFLGQ